jgi:5-oxoprolinase (ATP-hydrolysing) subunit A
MKTIDINADIGEGFANDSLLIPLISSANIACGGHAGDEKIMRETMEIALTANIAIGAHPGYEDRPNFGRIPLDLTKNELRDSIEKQLTRFLQISNICGALPHHVKPHGALYNQANQQQEIATVLIETIAHFMPGTKIYCPPQGLLSTAAIKANLQVIPEGFADRRYEPDGTLQSRNIQGSVIHNIIEATAQALLIATHQQVTTTSGTTITLSARTLCIHGDSPNALPLLQAIHKSFRENHITIHKP